jgi:phospholipase C
MAKLSALRRWMLLIAVGGLGLGRGWAQETAGGPTPDVTIAPKSSAVVSARVIDAANEPAISAEEKLQLIRRHIKYVFVLFQENRSFDFYFGSYPGADGLYAGPNGPYAPGQVAGFTQTIVNTDGTLGTVTPFKIPATVTDAARRCRSI